MKENTLPAPGVLSTRIQPPICSMICRQMANPSPVPPKRRVVELSAWVKEVKSRACCSAVMPMPVSLTAQRMLAMSPSMPSNSAVTVIVPRSVNLMALLSRFSSTWLRRRSSPIRVVGMSSAIRVSMSRSRAEGASETIWIWLLIVARRSNSPVSSVSFPASFFEKSSRSLISRNSEIPAPLILAT